MKPGLHPMGIRGFAAILLFTGIFACRQASNVQVTAPRPSWPDGEVEVVVPCSGPGFFTDGEAFRANAVGESIDLSVSKRKAMSNARAQLAASIQTTVRTVTENYVNATEQDNREEIEERFESLTREVVAQELRGIRKICERYFRTPESKYKTYVAIELPAQELANAYQNRLQQMEGKTVGIDYEKFKQSFEAEMLKMKA
ncbi:MAG TPA: hypothetical protein PLM35_04880, partial [Cyclobacteriaceae bacterium]|nr:hypothetical protein [Cyclobacteriaceae bacterium]